MYSFALSANCITCRNALPNSRSSYSVAIIDASADISCSGFEKGETRSRACIRVCAIGFDSAGLNELCGLLTTLETQIPHQVLVGLRKINPGTYVGQGKLEEIKALGEIDAFIFDADLSPSQLKNLEKILEKPVLDRAGVILEIFSRHARTKESKTQVELAKLQYLLPRLAHFWTHFERQRGGIGMKGMGEKQIEVDRRLLKDRMKVLRERLRTIEKERTVQRSGRKDVLKVALVGYTNAGKSTLLNALTQSHVLAEDKLFATLDASVRALDPHTHPPLVAIDTVGFISRIPPALIASFRSTLEELYEADLLVHVVDASSEFAHAQYQTTLAVLKELELSEKPIFTVLNKIDLLKNKAESGILAQAISPGAMKISSFNNKDVIKLRDTIITRFKKDLPVYELMLPFSEGKLESQLHAHGTIETKKILQNGVYYKVRMSDAFAGKLQLKRFQI